METTELWIDVEAAKRFVAGQATQDDLAMMSEVCADALRSDGVEFDDPFAATKPEESEGK